MAPSADARAAFSQNQISRRTPASPGRESVALAHGLGEIRRRHFTELVFLDLAAGGQALDAVGKRLFADTRQLAAQFLLPLGPRE